MCRQEEYEIGECVHYNNDIHLIPERFEAKSRRRRGL